MPSPGLVRAHPRRRAARASATTAASLPGYTVPVFYDSMIAKLVAWGGDRDGGDRADAPRARRIPGPRHPDDDSVLPLADARARLLARPLRHDLSRSPARSRGAASRSARSPDDEEQQIAIAAALDAWFRAGASRRRRRRRRHAARSAWTKRARGRKRCAPTNDLRDRARTAAAAPSRSSAPAPTGGSASPSTASRAIVDARRSGESGVSLLVPRRGRTGGAAIAVRARPGAAASCSRTSAAATSASSVNGRRTGRAAADSGGAAHGEQKVVAPMPGRVVRVLVAPGDDVERAPAGRGRRSDEDGERAALAQGRPRQGRVGHARHLGRGRARAGRHRITWQTIRSLHRHPSETPAPAAERPAAAPKPTAPRSIRSCARLAHRCSARRRRRHRHLLHHRSRAVAEEAWRSSRARSSSIGRCTSASCSIVLRTGVVRGRRSGDRRARARPIGRSSTAKTRRPSTLPWWTFFTHELIVENVDMTDWDMLVEQFPTAATAFRELGARRSRSKGIRSRFTTTVRAGDGAQRAVHLRRPHHAVDGRLPQPERQRLQAASTPTAARAQFTNGTVKILQYERVPHRHADRGSRSTAARSSSRTSTCRASARRPRSPATSTSPNWPERCSTTSAR